MTIRERLAKQGKEPKQAKPVPAPVIPDVQCVHRSWNPVGKIRCNCSHQPVVYGCDCTFVASGYATPQLPQKPGDGPILLADGTKLLPVDDRYPSFLPMPLREGESPRPCDVVICSTCPYRVDPPPHIATLRRLGIVGNYEPDTGHCDILHIAIGNQKWVQHASDWAAASPESMRSCTINVNRIDDLGPAIEFTGCKLLIGHAASFNPSVVEEAARKFPNVRFWVVYHGSQNSMVTNALWMQNQLKFLELTDSLPNFWYGTPEPTAPFGLWYKKFKRYPNTFPFEMPDSPRTLHDPPVLLFGGRSDVIKGHAASILAAAIIAKDRPIRLESMVEGNPSTMSNLATAAKIQLYPQPYRTSSAFRDYFRNSVSVLLNPSLTDAFQYVGMDALIQGCPVVGSQTIRYLPREWQADPNDPYDIARIATMFLDDYDRYSAEALRIAREVRDRQLVEYHQCIDQILE